MSSTPLNIGFIGLGIMGAPMALHLIKAGHQLFVYTRGKLPAERGRELGHACASAKGVAERADIVFTMVPDTPDVEAVLFGAERRGRGPDRKGKTVVDMSSISPIETKAFARRSTRSAATTSTRRCPAAKSAPRPRR